LKEAFEMTLSGSFDISAEGLSAQSTRMKIHANNIANINTPNYVRKIPVLAENYQMSFTDIITNLRNGVINTGISYGPGGVTMAGIVADPTPGKRVYEPGHPEADKNGYVTLSNVNVMTDMADAMNTSRLYEANLAVVGIVKNMANRALEIGRGQ
jgi:flagellar basal-body rod protein FlgC